MSDSEEESVPSGVSLRGVVFHLVHTFVRFARRRAQDEEEEEEEDEEEELVEEEEEYEKAKRPRNQFIYEEAGAVEPECRPGSSRHHVSGWRLSPPQRRRTRRRKRMSGRMGLRRC